MCATQNVTLSMNAFVYNVHSGFRLRSIVTAHMNLLPRKRQHPGLSGQQNPDGRHARVSFRVNGRTVVLKDYGFLSEHVSGPLISYGHLFRNG